MKVSGVIEFSEYQHADQSDLIALWKECKLTRPWNDPAKDIAFATQSTNATILIGKIASTLVASAMIGHDGHRGVLYYVAVSPNLQKQGIGKELIIAAEAWLKYKGVWKINILVRDDNPESVGFYKALGFVENAAVSLGKRIG